jgi:ribosomal protein S12 methylthiotransferase accessory factor YcaO
MGSVHGASAATVEEEAELDQALEDMFEQDASRLFWLNRIPRALTSG